MSSVDRDFILHHFAYHHWASDRVLESVAALSVDQLDEPWGGSFRSGRALLHHVVGAEFLWCERWNGRSPKGFPEFPATWSGRDYLKEWKKIRAEQHEYMSGLSRDLLMGDLTYLNTKNEKWTYRLSEILIHVVNHGTYHRGQLTHLLRDMGLAAPSTDYILWMAEQRESRT